MINLSIQNFVPVLVIASTPLRIEEYQRKGGTESKQDPVGSSQVQNSLHVPRLLFVEKMALVSKAFPKFQRADSSS